jgi:SagB-type dehydrogenase family enzyme
MNQEIKNNRNAIKPSWSKLREIKTPRDLKLERPVQFKQARDNATLIDLEQEFPTVTQKTLADVIASRRSLRQYANTPLSKEEVSYLLFETARVDSYRNNATFRTIPTGGATNAMETYVFINNVKDVETGLYHYVQIEHKLALIDQSDGIQDKMNQALYQQLRDAAIVVIMTAIPYRSEYKYAHCAHKMIAMEAGHAGQNLSLAAEVIDSGACCLAAYHQDLLDEVLQVDGEEEFATYAITVGKKG